MRIRWLLWGFYEVENNIIEIKSLSKTFHGQTVLNNINLNIKNGEFLTILGPSGCGKTTLLRLLSGLELADSGQIFFKNQDITHWPPQQREIKTVFQSFALFPHMTVFDNVAFGLKIKKLAKNVIEKRVDAALKMVKLESLANRKPSQLSGGQQQRVAIARAVVNQPAILLLDEPLSALDYQLRKNMQFELKSLQQQLGITFILVTHDQEEALTMADRIVVMKDGNIEQVGTPRQIYEEPNNVYIAKFVGQANIFDVTVLEANQHNVVVSLENRTFLLTNKKGFNKGDKALLLLRPEDLHVLGSNEVNDSGMMIPAKVEQFIYKGSTVDLILRSASGQKISATEFFDEDDEKLEYAIGESVLIEWVPGWEVLLPYEE